MKLLNFAVKALQLSEQRFISLLKTLKIRLFA